MVARLKKLLDQLEQRQRGSQSVEIYRLRRLKSELSQTEFQSVIRAAQCDMIEIFLRAAPRTPTLRIAPAW